MLLWSDFEAIMRDLDPKSFVDCNFGLYLLSLVGTFSRSEHLPTTFTGMEGTRFDKAFHWQVKDFGLKFFGTLKALKIKIKGIKQDGRQERPEARGEGDWRYLGDVEDPVFSPLLWYRRLMAHYADREGGRDLEDSMFYNETREHPYLFVCVC